MSADWLIGCDGAHSMVRHSVDAPFTGETVDSDWMLELLPTPWTPR